MYAHVKKLEEEAMWNYKDAKNTQPLDPENEKKQLAKLQRSDNYLINSVNAKYAMMNKSLLQEPSKLAFERKKDQKDQKDPKDPKNPKDKKDKEGNDGDDEF